MLPFSSRLRWVAGFVLAYMAVGVGLAVAYWNYEFIYYGLVMVGLISLAALVDRRVQFSQTALWGLAIWGLMHLAGGLVAVPEQFVEAGLQLTLYNLRPMPWLPKFDQLVHAFGFGICAIAAHEALNVHLQRRLQLDISGITTLFLISMGLGAVNEVIEFTATLLLPETNVGGYINTGWDLISNGTGAALGIIFLGWRQRRSL